MTNELKENSLLEKQKSDSSSEDHKSKSVEDDKEEQKWKDWFGSDSILHKDESSKKLNTEKDKTNHKYSAEDEDTTGEGYSDDYSEDSSDEVKQFPESFI